MGFWKKVAKFLDSLELDDRDDYDNTKVEYKGKKEDRHWCPLCGYSGTADNLRCHIINDHKKDIE